MTDRPHQGTGAPGGASVPLAVSEPAAAPAAQASGQANGESTLQYDLESLEVSPGGGCDTLVGECLATEHPTLAGRILVSWRSRGSQPIERWLPALHGLSFRPGDRVLLTFAANWAEPVVIGVVDGFAERPPRPLGPPATLTLQPDEAIRVTSATGQPLCEIGSSDAGPVLKVLSADLELEVPGKLRLRAGSIELEAERGELRLEARDDVVVQGENINLN